MATTHPAPYSDTDPRAMKAWLNLQRSMPPGEKLANILKSSQFVLQMYEMGVRRQYPHANEHEVLLRVAARHLPRELMIRAYGWDPGEESSADEFQPC